VRSGSADQSRVFDSDDCRRNVAINMCVGMRLRGGAAFRSNQNPGLVRAAASSPTRCEALIMPASIPIGSPGSVGALPPPDCDCQAAAAASAAAAAAAAATAALCCSMRVPVILDY
jgi:hypothetical protein